MSYEKEIIHIHDNTELESVFFIPDGDKPFPAVLLFHEYTGLNEVILNHARRISAAGYAVLAADFYGKENRPANLDEARTAHRVYRNDRLLMRERAKACLNILEEQPEVDKNFIYGLGFSFGGGAILELARTGANLKGVASVYGYLDTTHPADPEDIKCPLLVLHVENDPVVPEEHAELFKSEMENAAIEYKMIRIADARHGFANPNDSGFDAATAETMWETVLKWMAESRS